MQKLRNPTKTFFVNIQLAPMHNRHHHHKHIICYNIITKRIVTPLLGDVLLLSQDFVFYQSPPADVALLVSLDAVGTLYERFCSPISFS